MTLEELNKWISTAELIHSDCEVDDQDNHWVTNYYAKEGKFFAQDFLADPNNFRHLVPCIARDENWLEKGEYEPMPVNRRIDTIIVNRYTYSDEDGNDIVWFDEDVVSD